MSDATIPATPARIFENVVAPAPTTCPRDPAAVKVGPHRAIRAGAWMWEAQGRVWEGRTRLSIPPPRDKGGGVVVGPTSAHFPSNE
jgi:hypothetical protein